MQAGDIILEFNGQPIRKLNELPRLVGESQPGMRVNMKIWRKGTTHSLQVQIAAVDDQVATGKAEGSQQGGKAEKAPESALGLAVMDLSEKQKSYLHLKDGVYITAINPAVAASGLRRGDIILRVNDIDIKNAAQFQRAVSGLNRTKTIVFLVQRGDVIFFVPLKPAA